jgi:hypothetical protein
LDEPENCDFQHGKSLNRGGLNEEWQTLYLEENELTFVSCAVKVARLCTNVMYSFRILVGKTERKQPFGRLRYGRVVMLT